MKVRNMDKIHKLRSKVEEDCPGCTYISKTTTDHGKKGRLLGFDLGDGLQVGVFSRANTNMAKIIVRGDQTGREDAVNRVKDQFYQLGFLDT